MNETDEFYIFKVANGWILQPRINDYGALVNRKDIHVFSTMKELCAFLLYFVETERREN